jgi:1,4-dihydroxy-2-naphthoyl-CoA synthase
MTRTAPRPARYFAVQGGHVHTAGCGHATAQRRGAAKTAAVHVAEFDGKTEAEVAAIVGDMRCAHCFHDAPAKPRKITAADFDRMTGATARREAAKAERARKATVEATDALLVALQAAFNAAKAIEDHDTAGLLYGQVCARRAALGL